MKTRMITGALAPLGIAALIGCGGGSSPVEPIGGGGSTRKILYTAKVGGNWDIFLRNADGSGEVRVTSDSEEESSACLSPDGTKVAYLISSSEPNEVRLFIRDSDGRNPEELPVALRFGGALRWSPNSRALLLSTQVNFNTIPPGGSSDTISRSALLQVNLGGGQPVILAPDATQASAPYQHPETGFVYDFTGLEDTQRGRFRPDMFDDGNTIVYDAVSTNGTFDIWTMSRTGGAHRKIIATPGGFAVKPRISPNGQRVVFLGKTSTVGGSGTLQTAKIDGSDVVTLASGGSLSDQPNSPTWSPDGNQIAFKFRGRHALINADGTGLTFLPNPAGAELLGDISWK